MIKNVRIIATLTAGLFLLLLVSAGLTFAATKKAAATEAIKIGTNRALGTVTPYVGKAQGVFAKRGIAVDIIDVTDGSTLMEAFASGQLDIALLGIAPAAIWKSKGVPLKVVASANGGGACAFDPQRHRHPGAQRSQGQESGDAQAGHCDGYPV